MTMKQQNQESLSTYLQEIGESLDIPEHQFDDGVVRYERIGEWLGAEDSELREYAPQIYSQGSFRLGTVVKPLNSKGSYDIDLVCHLDIRKDSISQADLKKKVGERIKAQPDLEARTTESGRCWTLKWENLFHMDVLPAIPNEESRPNGILLTDKDLVRWQKSNPIQYADWFRERMRIILNEKRASLAKSLDANIEDVPEWQVKTPLQRAIQILKRHRDLYFSSNSSKRPASIILTTLAANSYGNQEDLFEALTNIISGMPKYIEVVNGKYFVTNPADDQENFADKWNEDPKRREAFLGWVGKVQSDFDVWVASSHDLTKSYQLFESSLGKDVAGSAVKLAEQLLQKTGNIVPIDQSLVPQLGSASHARAPLWTVEPNYRASIKGSVHLGRKKKKLWDLSARPVGKNLGLKFELQTDAPPPFEVYWQVVNTGAEAASVENGLRGQIEKDAEGGGTIHWEDTSYRGTHWVEAYVVKGGKCVARTGKKLVRIR